MLFYIINKYALNIPFDDDFGLLAFLNDLHINWTFDYFINNFAKLYNEHPIGIPRTIAFFDYFIFDELNFKRLIIYGNIFLILIYYFLIRFQPNIYTFLFAGLLIFIPNYEFNLWSISSIHHLSIELFAILSFYFLLHKNSWPSFFIGIMSSLSGMITHAAGYFILPIAIPFILISKNIKQKHIKLAILLIVSATALFVYLNVFKSPAHHPKIIPVDITGLFKLVQYYFTLLGANYYFFNPHPIYTPILGATTVAVFIAIAITHFRQLLKKPWHLAIIAFVLLNGLAISVSRYGFGWQQALSPRYKIIPIILLVCLVLIVSEIYKRNKYFIASGCLLLLVFLINYIRGFNINFSQINNHHQSLVTSLVRYQTGQPDAYMNRNIAGVKYIIRAVEEKNIYSLPKNIINNLPAYISNELTIDSDNVKCHWEYIYDSQSFLNIKGSAILEGTNCRGLEYYLTLTGKNNQSYCFGVQRTNRPDAQNTFWNRNICKNSGFNFLLLKNESGLPSEIYSLGLTLINPKTHQSHYFGSKYLIPFHDGNAKIIENSDYQKSLIQIEAFNNLPISNNTDSIHLETTIKKIELKGWAFIANDLSPARRIYYRLNNAPVVPNNFIYSRPDVAKFYNNAQLDTVGFKLTIPKEKLKPVTNKIELFIESRSGRIMNDSRILYITQ